MFNLSLIKTDKLNHLYNETSALAIENVRLSKENTKLKLAVAELDSALTSHQHLIRRMEAAINTLDKQNRFLKRVLGHNSGRKRRKRK